MARVFRIKKSVLRSDTKSYIRIKDLRKKRKQERQNRKKGRL